MTKDEKQLAWAQSYRLALLCFLREKPSGSLLPATKLGHHAVTLGLETLDVAKFHAHILTTLRSSDNTFQNTEQETVKQAEAFFTETTIPISETHHTAIKAKNSIIRLEKALNQRVTQLRRSTGNSGCPPLAAGITNKAAPRSSPVTICLNLLKPHADKPLA